LLSGGEVRLVLAGQCIRTHKEEIDRVSDSYKNGGVKDGVPDDTTYGDCNTDAHEPDVTTIEHEAAMNTLFLQGVPELHPGVSPKQVAYRRNLKSCDQVSTCLDSWLSGFASAIRSSTSVEKSACHKLYNKCISIVAFKEFSGELEVGQSLKYIFWDNVEHKIGRDVKLDEEIMAANSGSLHIGPRSVTNA
jgi:hypothetical protein